MFSLLLEVIVLKNKYKNFFILPFLKLQFGSPEGKVAMYKFS